MKTVRKFSLKEVVCAVQNPEKAAKFQQAAIDNVERLRKELAEAERIEEECNRMVYLIRDAVVIDGIPIRVDGWYYSTLVENDEGSLFRADIYELAGKPGLFAVNFNEVNHRKWFSPPFRWNGGRVMGLGKNWTLDEAKQAALGWCLKQNAKDACY